MVTPEVRIVHRDEHLLVVAKPAGLPTTSPDGRGCLVELVERLDSGAPRLHPTSRLDAEVTGLVTFARTRRATEALLAARRTGRYARRYVALGSGTPQAAEGSWTWPIAIDPRDKRLRVPGPGPGEKHAETTYRVVASVTLACALHLAPHTGRTHQLRVHAKAAGLPLLGDVAYGGPRRLVRPDGRVVTPARVMLHCARLALPRIEGGGVLQLHEPVPDDIRSIWAALGGDAALLEPGPLVSN